MSTGKGILIMSDNETAPLSKAERLAEIETQVAACTACDLHKTRTKTVFGMGNPNAPLVLIGEGPGQNEDATGLPFVGRSGVLLDECLRLNGITRKHIYICNVVRCRACLYEAGRLKNRPPTTEETQACQPWLERTLQTLQPPVILCLGAPSANAIIRKGFRMTQERGTWHESKYARFAMATWHPAYILRLTGDEYAQARQELIEHIDAARRKVIEARKEPPANLTLF